MSRRRGIMLRYSPARVQPKNRSSANGGPAERCNGKTKDGTPCERLGKCPIKSHAANKVTP
jgi:hypothetical protein